MSPKDRESQLPPIDTVVPRLVEPGESLMATHVPTDDDQCWQVQVYDATSEFGWVGVDDGLCNTYEEALAHKACYDGYIPEDEMRIERLI
jgi:hypothetical protein